MRILFAGGGTAGHLIPALAMANILKNHDPNGTIVFLTSPGGVEANLLKNHPYPTYQVPIFGLKRTFSLKAIKSILSVPKAVLKTVKYLKSNKIDLVIGTGGYVSYPALKAAKLCRIPYLIHESNSIPGLVTKQMASGAKAVLMNYETVRRELPKHTNAILAGNYILSQKSTRTKEDIRKSLHMKKGEILVLAFGGSLGAKSINRAVVEMAKTKNLLQKGIHILLSTGPTHYETVKDELGKMEHLPQNIHLFSYLSPMSNYWDACDIAICRGGACTLSELGYFGKAGIVIPYPHAAKNHQYHNAKTLSNAGGCLMIEDAALTGDSLYKTMMDLAENPHKRHSLAMGAKRVCRSNNAPLLISAVFDKK